MRSLSRPDPPAGWLVGEKWTSRAGASYLSARSVLEAKVDEASTAPQPVPPESRTPRSILAPPFGIALCAERYRLLSGSGATCRGRPLRLDLPGRHAGADGHCGSRRQQLAGAGHGARRAGDDDKPHRLDRHGLHDLCRALQSCPPVRLARPHQQRARRLEYRHLVAGRRCAQLWRQRPREPRRALRARRGIRAGRQGAVGQLGRRRRARRSRKRPLRQARPHPADRSRGQVLSCRRAAQHAALAAGPAGVRPGGLVRYRAASRRVTPRRYSPRRWRRRRRRRSTPT